jgi:hypothetical protein
MATRDYKIGSGADERSAGGCWICAVLAQCGMNVALLLDLALNVILLGSPLETLSQRAARARRAGSKPAAAFCAVLTWVWKQVFRSSEPDHCAWALSPGSVGREIWHWTDDWPAPPPPPDERR